MDERGHLVRPEELEMDRNRAEDGAGQLVVDRAHPQSVESDTTLTRRRIGSVVGQEEVDDVSGVMYGEVLSKNSCGVWGRI